MVNADRLFSSARVREDVLESVSGEAVLVPPTTGCQQGSRESTKLARKLVGNNTVADLGSLFPVVDIKAAVGLKTVAVYQWEQSQQR